jgi:hypothetical protein
MQRGSSHLYTAFIDFKQAYDSIPRDKLWDHLNYCQMPQHLVSILQGLYHAEKYTMLDTMETKKQMCNHFLVSNKNAPSPPYYFQFT